MKNQVVLEIWGSFILKVWFLDLEKLREWKQS